MTTDMLKMATSPARARQTAPRRTAPRRTARRIERRRAKGAPVHAWLVAPRGELARRFCLLGMVVALHNLLELPRDLLTGHLGARITGFVVMLAVAGSLALLLVALRPRVPTWRLLRTRAFQVAILLLTLAAVPIGVRQLGAAAVAGFQAPYYPNDGTTLDHYAAVQLAAGHNPYVTTDIVSAVRTFHQDPALTTPLRRGAFAALPPTSPPSKAVVRATFATEPVGRPGDVLEFESHVSYPALAVLSLVLLVQLGLPSVVPFFALCLLALAILLLASVPAAARPWIGLLLLADTPLLNAAAIGDLDVFYILLLFVAWRWWRRPALSTLAFGLALAAKQLAWFYTPFYLIRVWHERGWRAAAARALGAGGVFVALNLPFFLNNPHAWLAGVLAPQVDPMFPAGNGLVRLALLGLVPLAPSWVYAGLELLALVACIVWYWRHGRRMPEVGFVLAVLPLWFAWRSLTTYFYFVALPSVALLLARLSEGNREGATAGKPPARAVAVVAAPMLRGSATRVGAEPRRRTRRL